MDTRSPFRIVPKSEVPTTDERHHYVPLSREDEEALLNATPEQRVAWFRAKYGPTERLSMVLEAAGASWLAQRARDGLYGSKSKHPSPKLLLIRDLKNAALYRIATLVRAGEFDDFAGETANQVLSFNKAKEMGR